MPGADTQPAARTVVSFPVSARDGVVVCRGAASPGRVDRVLRLLHLDLLTRGAPADELGEWLWAAHWFPHLRHHALLRELAGDLPASWRTGEPCDPQILLQFPHTGPEPEITFHLDQEPDWAHGRRYARIVGVALSPWCEENGGLLVDCGGTVRSVALRPGDAVMMPPDVWHSGGINRTGSIRYGVYFRWLAPEPGAPPVAARSSRSRSARVRGDSSATAQT